MRKIEIYVGDLAQLEPRCNGAWKPDAGFPGGAEVWHARCPVCDAELLAEVAGDAVDRATDHCSRKRMRAEIDQLRAALARIEGRE